MAGRAPCARARSTGTSSSRCGRFSTWRPTSYEDHGGCRARLDRDAEGGAGVRDVHQLAVRRSVLQLALSRTHPAAVRSDRRDRRHPRIPRLLRPQGRPSDHQGDDMSQAAAIHGAVEPAESPITPESWGKLGMWIFLAGDAVGFGTLLSGYGVMRATSADWPSPYEVLGITLTPDMTLLLIWSSVTIVKALEWLVKGDKVRATRFLLLT